MSRSWSYAKPIFTLQFEDTTRIPRFQDIKTYLFLHTSDYLLLSATILIGMLWLRSCIVSLLFPYFLNLFLNKVVERQGTHQKIHLKFFNKFLCIEAHSRKSTSWICDVDPSIQNNNVESTFLSHFSIRVHPHWNYLTSLPLHLSKLVFEKN